MHNALRKRTDRGDGGFTLIELMVVVLIIAILIAIAIPTFLGARKRAQERAAQSNIRNAFTAEKTHYTDNQAYTAAPGTLEDIEPSLTYAADAVPAAAGTVYVHVDGATGVLTLGAKSASGKCFYLRDNPAGPGTTFEKPADCPAPSLATVDDPSW